MIQTKSDAIKEFHDHVSSGKADFFKHYGMDFVMGRREGPYLYDLDGDKRLINLHCNGGVFNLGHRNAELIQIVKDALDDLDIGNHHLMSRERAETARLLADLMPGDLTYTVFGVGGGEAVDLALKVARGYTHRPKIISARGGYHGHTGLALAAGDEAFRAPFGPLSPGFVQVPFLDLEALEAELDDTTAAVILETIPATLGIVIPSREYLQEVRRLCDRAGALLILDEVQTGLGRTGKLWAFEHFDVLPDMVVLGKGLSGGVYPITATVMREPLEAVFHPDPFIHISTFGGAEVGCRVARRVLEISSSTEFLGKVNQLAQEFAAGLSAIQQRQSRFFKGYRQLGCMIGLEFRDEVSGKIMTKTAYDEDLLLIYAGNDPSVCQCLPPLTLDRALVPDIMIRLENAIKAAKRLRPLAKMKMGMDGLVKRMKGEKA
ncbi:MAG: aspartate aminotransferase family protein [FCB group bacterium]|nr:aspartate aminotransferase family protein [FCB group bacterium]